MAAAIMGVFVCTYNFINYVLLAEPYELSQTQVGLIYFLFVAGTVASAVMGRLADKVGNAKILLVSLVIMFAGVGLTCAPSLAIKLFGVGFVTYGFFGAHSTAASWVGKLSTAASWVGKLSTAASWVGKLSTADKARLSAGYMLVYYVGASVFGTAGGKFLSTFGRPGVALFMSAVLSIALILSVKLFRST